MATKLTLEEHMNKYLMKKMSTVEGRADMEYISGCSLLYPKDNSKVEASDSERGLKLLISAATAGHLPAQFALAVECSEGLNIPVNHSEAFKYYKLAADQGHAVAQNQMAKYYQTGMIGCPVNLPESARYRELAAKQGHIEAILFCGVGYQFGAAGFPLDVTKGFAYSLEAADKGNKNAQYYVGEQYIEGITGKSDAVNALKYYKLAAAQGHPEAIEKIKLLETSTHVTDVRNNAVTMTQGDVMIPDNAMSGTVLKRSEWFGSWRQRVLAYDPILKQISFSNTAGVARLVVKCADIQSVQKISPSQADRRAFCFSISFDRRVIKLQCESATHTEVWVKLLTSASQNAKK